MTSPTSTGSNTSPIPPPPPPNARSYRRPYIHNNLRHRHTSWQLVSVTARTSAPPPPRTSWQPVSSVSPSTSAPLVSSVPPSTSEPPVSSVPPPTSAPPVSSVPPPTSAPPVSSVPPRASAPSVSSVPPPASAPPVSSVPPRASAPPVSSVPPPASAPPVSSVPLRTSAPPLSLPPHPLAPPVSVLPHTSEPPLSLSPYPPAPPVSSVAPRTSAPPLSLPPHPPAPPVSDATIVHTPIVDYLTLSDATIVHIPPQLPRPHSGSIATELQHVANLSAQLSGSHLQLSGTLYLQLDLTGVLTQISEIKPETETDPLGDQTQTTNPPGTQTQTKSSTDPPHPPSPPPGTDNSNDEWLNGDRVSLMVSIICTIAAVVIPAVVIFRAPEFAGNDGLYPLFAACGCVCLVLCVAALAIVAFWEEDLASNTLLGAIFVRLSRAIIVLWAMILILGLEWGVPRKVRNHFWTVFQVVYCIFIFVLVACGLRNLWLPMWQFLQNKFGLNKMGTGIRAATTERVRDEELPLLEEEESSPSA